MGANGGVTDLQNQQLGDGAGCSDASSPTPVYNVDGNNYTYQELLDAFGTTDGTEFEVDPDDVVSCGESPLPVELIAFNGTPGDNKVILQWTTATEINNDRFEVERSYDGFSFDKIDVVTGNGNTKEIIHYQFEDNNPLWLQNYYRLKQVDYDGQYEYSNTIVVIMNGYQSSGWQIYPNPVSTNHLTFKSLSQLETGAYFTISDLNGKLLKRSELLNIRNSTLLSIDVTDIAKGTYVLHVVNGQVTWQQKIIISD